MLSTNTNFACPGGEVESEIEPPCVYQVLPSLGCLGNSGDLLHILSGRPTTSSRPTKF